MNREIKFRAWNIEKNQWVDNLLDLVAIESCAGEMSKITFDNTYLQFNQFTGLKDKNDVDIYEGDIVRLYDGFGRKIKEYIIKWNDRGAYEYFSTNKDSFHIAVASIDTYSLDYVGVIGNIYENPELLEKIKMEKK